MVEINIEELKRKGLTCARLRSMEKNKLEDAKMFRKVGFENLAKTEEVSASKVRNLRKKVCLLK